MAGQVPAMMMLKALRFASGSRDKPGDDILR
jgi:hypothetical protein